MSEILKALSTGNSYFVIFAIVLSLLPALKFLEDARRSRYGVRKDKLDGYLLALKDYLSSDAEHKDYLKYRLELAFQAHYGKDLSCLEIRELLRKDEPLRSIKKYLQSRPFLTLIVENGKAKRFFFKKEQKRYNINIFGKRYRLHAVMVNSYISYCLLGSFGGLILLYGVPLAIHYNSWAGGGYVLVMAITCIVLAVSSLLTGMSFDTARKYIAR
ncbi:hypothetical protein [Janthinobacterium sp. B9-8]|uniref:hypothetical protein n=1 Tax=Janthinobacterium sp. B9-8 TaxID=1236179 RepID=UPI00061CF0C5|nr:hypothetical protein [Janthinobacterium sp. B9-8]AMC35758.1 hypothetical protein VN23_14640 [Janthinobacterium sp. B9-8]